MYSYLIDSWNKLQGIRKELKCEKKDKQTFFLGWANDLGKKKRLLYKGKTRKLLQKMLVFL